MNLRKLSEFTALAFPDQVSIILVKATTKDWLQLVYSQLIKVCMHVWCIQFTIFLPGIYIYATGMMSWMHSINSRGSSTV